MMVIRLRHLLLLLLALAVLAYLSLLGWGAYLGYRQIQQSSWLIHSDEITNLSIKTAVITGKERGMTALAVTAPPHGYPALSQDIMNLRQQRDDGHTQIQSALRILMAERATPALHQQARYLHQANETLMAARARADQSLADGTPFNTDAWLQISSRYIDALADLRRAVQAFGDREERFQIRAAFIQDALFTAIDYAGRERILIGSAIAMQRPLSNSERQRLNRMRGVVEKALASLDLQLGDLLEVPTIRDARNHLHLAFLGEYEQLRESIYKASPTSAYPVDTGQWFHESETAIQSLVALANTLSTYTFGSLRERETTVRKYFLWLAGAGFTLISLMTGLVFLLYIRGIHPLRQLERAAKKISEGDLGTSLALSQHDELGRTMYAIEKMRQDLVETMQQQEATNHLLLESEKRYRALIENVADWVWEINLDGIYTYSSPQVENILGYTPEELREKTPFDLMPEDEANRMREFYARLLENPTPVHATVNLNQHKNGRLVWIESSATPIYSADKQLQGYRGIDRDITTRIATEERLRKMAQVLEQTDDLVIITNKEGHIEYVNPSFEKHTGYSRSEIVGESPRFLKSGNQPDALYKDLWQRLSKGEVMRVVVINQRKDGSSYIEDKTITPIRDAQGAITHYVSTGKDITAQRELEQQLQRRERMASIGLLSAGMAHEINNPMSYVSANLGLLREHTHQLLELIAHHQHCLPDMADLPGPYPGIPAEKRLEILRDEMHSLFQDAADGISRVRHIVRGLNDYAHPSTDHWQETDVNQELDRCLQLMAHQIPQSVRVIKHYATLPTVQAIPQQIDQVIMNLLLNAVQAMNGEGSIELRTCQHDDQLCIEVGDSGCGMDKSELGQLFNPFYTTKPVGQGTGLGLHVAWRIIEKHHGRIEVESTPGEGSLFRIHLPLTSPAA